MPKYKHKPILVEALQFEGGNSDQVIEFSQGKCFKMTEKLHIESGEWNQEVKQGDWVVRDSLGNFSLWKDKDFNDTFDEIICEPTT